MSRKKVSDEMILKIAAETENVGEACVKAGITFNAFKPRAIELGVYRPTGKNSGRFIPLEEILDGKHPQYQTFKLRNRLIKEGVMQNTCSECGVGPLWNGKPIQCQLDHRDGDRHNHKRGNLRMLCANCHSQTETFSGKNKACSVELESGSGL